MAEVKISDLSAAGALVGTEVLPIVQSSATVKATIQAVANLSPVTSVFARTGAVTAQSGDYTVGQVTNALNKTGDTMTGTLNLPSNGLVVGTDQLVVSGGKVGIGTTGPGALLELAKNSATEYPILRLSQLYTADAATQEIGSLEFYRAEPDAGASVRAKILAYSQDTPDRDSELQFYTKSVAGALTQQMVINNAGNLGIGLTGPTQKLDVNGNIGISGTEIITSARALQNLTAAAGLITSDTFDAARIPSLAESKITNLVTDLANRVARVASYISPADETAAITTTVLCTFPASPADLYRVNLEQYLTQAAGTSSETHITISWTDPTNTIHTLFYDSSTNNVVGAEVVTQGTFPFIAPLISVKGGTDFTYAVSYVSVGSPVMKYRVKVILEAF